MTVGERIKKFAKMCYGNQGQFCKEANINYSMFSFYATNQRNPGLSILQKFKEAGMSIDWLLTGEGSMFAENTKGKILKAKFENLVYSSDNRSIKNISGDSNLKSIENSDKSQNFRYSDFEIYGNHLESRIDAIESKLEQLLKKFNEQDEDKLKIEDLKHLMEKKLIPQKVAAGRKSNYIKK